MPTVIVRLWEAAASVETADTALRGVVNIVGENETSPFVGEDELLTILRRVSGARSADA